MYPQVRLPTISIEVAGFLWAAKRRLPGYSPAMPRWGVKAASSGHIPNITNSPERTWSRPTALRRNGHCGRGGFAVHASRALLGNAISSARSL